MGVKIGPTLTALRPGNGLKRAQKGLFVPVLRVFENKVFLGGFSGRDGPPARGAKTGPKSPGAAQSPGGAGRVRPRPEAPPAAGARSSAHARLRTA